MSRAALARVAPVGAAAAPEPLVEARDLVKHFPLGRGVILRHDFAAVHAVDGVSFSIGEGETLGLVGETGSGKSTVARLVTRLLEPTSGRVLYAGRDITDLSRRRLRPLRRELQMIFQDPYSSLNPRRPVGAIVGEPLRVQGIGTPAVRRRRVQQLMERVGLNPEHYNRYPHEFSGGQRQRIGIARALVTTPKLIVADEPVSALDVSIQAQILNLLEDLQGDFGLTYLFIAHDLNVVRHVSDRVAVMYLGKLVEVAPSDELAARPIHPYTEALLAAVPVADTEARERRRRRLRLRGDMPSPVAPPPACRFHPRCPYATEICRTVEPPLVDYGNGHLAACHHPLNLAGSAPVIRGTARSSETPR
ncbi:MAG TPA: dipeptide ABC transporter ATP-binding protein [Gaiellaceae bacterium]|nr:dipeptide ABC transporter ATP-binding protein [Gaiellaceae bacterium]